MRSGLLRASLVLGLSISASAAADAAELLRVKGAVNYRNFAAFAALVYKANASPVVLDVTIPRDNEEAEGHLTTFVLDGQFAVSLADGDKSSSIYADTGFELVDDSYYALKGTFTVLNGDPRPATPDLMLEAMDTPAGATFRDVAAETLEPAN